MATIINLVDSDDDDEKEPTAPGPTDADLLLNAGLTEDSPLVARSRALRIGHFRAALDGRNISNAVHAILEEDSTDGMTEAIRDAGRSSTSADKMTSTLYSLSYFKAHYVMEALMRYGQTPFKSTDEIFEAKGVISSATVSYASFARLVEPLVWINDEAVNAVGALLEKSFAPFATKVAFIPSYYFADGGHQKSMRSYLKPERASFITACGYVFCPINIEDTHWVLLVGDTSNARWLFFDSYRDPFDSLPALTRRCFLSLHDQLVAFFPGRNWLPVVTNVTRFPRQFDGVSCGLYVLHTCECLAHAVVKSQFTKATWDDDRVQLRLHYAHAIASGALARLRLPGDPNTDNMHASEEVLTHSRSASSSSSSSSASGDDDDDGDEQDTDWQPPQKKPRYEACAFCAKEERLFFCGPWQRAFCGSKCQNSFAEERQLSYY